jgi:hypothetical protein
MSIIAIVPEEEINDDFLADENGACDEYLALKEKLTLMKTVYKLSSVFLYLIDSEEDINRFRMFIKIPETFGIRNMDAFLIGISNDIISTKNIKVEKICHLPINLRDIKEPIVNIDMYDFEVKAGDIIYYKNKKWCNFSADIKNEN